jgi:hypothetical protein
MFRPGKYRPGTDRAGTHRQGTAQHDNLLLVSHVKRNFRILQNETCYLFVYLPPKRLIHPSRGINTTTLDATIPNRVSCKHAIALSSYLGEIFFLKDGQLKSNTCRGLFFLCLVEG